MKLLNREQFDAENAEAEIARLIAENKSASESFARISARLIITCGDLADAQQKWSTLRNWMIERGRHGEALDLMAHLDAESTVVGKPLT